MSYTPNKNFDEEFQALSPKVESNINKNIDETLAFKLAGFFSSLPIDQAPLPALKNLGKQSKSWFSDLSFASPVILVPATLVTACLVFFLAQPYISFPESKLAFKPVDSNLDNPALDFSRSANSLEQNSALSSTFSTTINETGDLSPTQLMAASSLSATKSSPNSEISLKTMDEALNQIDTLIMTELAKLDSLALPEADSTTWLENS